MFCTFFLPHALLYFFPIIPNQSAFDILNSVNISFVFIRVLFTLNSQWLLQNSLITMEQNLVINWVSVQKVQTTIQIKANHILLFPVYTHLSFKPQNLPCNQVTGIWNIKDTYFSFDSYSNLISAVIPMVVHGSSHFVDMHLLLCSLECTRF